MTARCPCGGSDDYCVCQNVDLAALREQQKETAKDTYFAIAEYKARIDWFEAQVAALTAELAAAESENEDLTDSLLSREWGFAKDLDAERARHEASEASAAELRTALENAKGLLDTPIGRRRHKDDPFYEEVIASIRAAIAAKVPG